MTRFVRHFSKILKPYLITVLKKWKYTVCEEHSVSTTFLSQRLSELSKIWKTTFMIPESLNASERELKERNNHYFYINRLILDCQKVSVSTSPTVWQEIEDRMLRVP
jgi:hypothetical protein